MATEKHDADYYFSDGNIVLSAQNDNCTIYFRLHRTILVQHSPVFQDMFAMPPPQNMDEHDGASLVMMPDDADALRDFIDFFFLRLDDPDFTTKMLASTELAKKYQVDWIRKMVATQLRKLWPTTRAEYIRIGHSEVQEWIHDQVGEPWEPEETRYFPEPVSSIHLARECDAPAILPFAFLRLSSFPWEFDPNNKANPYSKIPRRDLLPQADFQRLMVARGRMGHWLSHLSIPDRWPWANCGNGSACEAATLRIWNKLTSDIAHDGNVLQSCQNWITRDSSYHPMRQSLCPTCTQRVDGHIGTLQHWFMGRIGTFFQLDDM
ncbi:hypothetical protein C8R43DRAFT_909138 [Mycena crocata]|nr:hypothetical protein C8R43DRAFT_909138 [Mycena crocata]